MIDSGPLTQEDADEYCIQIDNMVTNGSAIHAIDPDGDEHEPIEQIELKMSNHDALELAAQLLIGAVYNASDSDFRYMAWRSLLTQRIRSAAR